MRSTSASSTAGRSSATCAAILASRSWSPTRQTHVVRRVARTRRRSRTGPRARAGTQDRAQVHRLPRRRRTPGNRPLRRHSRHREDHPPARPLARRGRVPSGVTVVSEARALRLIRSSVSARPPSPRRQRTARSRAPSCWLRARGSERCCLTPTAPAPGSTGRRVSSVACGRHGSSVGSPGFRCAHSACSDTAGSPTRWPPRPSPRSCAGSGLADRADRGARGGRGRRDRLLRARRRGCLHAVGRAALRTPVRPAVVAAPAPRTDSDRKRARDRGRSLVRHGERDRDGRPRRLTWPRLLNHGAGSSLSVPSFRQWKYGSAAHPSRRCMTCSPTSPCSG